MASLPTPLRAALGLAVSALDQARHLPDKAIEVPMLAVSSALQLSLRLQQRYAALTARGDALLAGRMTTDEPPPWATFDDPVPAGSATAPGPLDDTTTLRVAPDVAVDGADEPRTGAPGGDGAGTPAQPKPPRPGKTVRRPRNVAPSAFDTVGEDED